MAWVCYWLGRPTFKRESRDWWLYVTWWRESILIQGCICQIFTGGVRVSTGYDWPSDYSGHGGCQIGKRRIVVLKYTGLATKWNWWGVIRGVRVDPQKGSAELSGGQLPLAGVKPPDSPRKIQPCSNHKWYVKRKIMYRHQYGQEFE